jgi:hypothetical protein
MWRSLYIIWEKFKHSVDEISAAWLVYDYTAVETVLYEATK